MPRSNRKPADAEKIINQNALNALIDIQKSAMSQAAEARGYAAAKIKAASEAQNLDLQVFRLVCQIDKMTVARQAIFKRNLDLYCDMRGLCTQMDLEDAIAETNAQADRRTDHEKHMDGDVDYEPADLLGKVRNPRPRMLTAFYEALIQATTPEAINKGLDRFTVDHPDLAEEAIKLAQERLAEIAAAQGGGKDLRPTHLQEAKQVATKGRPKGSKNKKPKKPSPPKKAPGRPKKVSNVVPMTAAR